MKVVDVIHAAGNGAYYYDDQAAIRAGAKRDGFLYVGAPRTPGFARIRQPAECLSIGLRLEDGFVAWGDALTVQYAAAGGREPLFRPAAAVDVLTRDVVPQLIERRLDTFVAAADEVLERSVQQTLPRSIEYGVSQALLRAVAHSKRCTMAEVVAAEFGLTLQPIPIPLFAQSGDDRYDAVDKMLLKGVNVLPHGLINSPEKFGRRGEVFIAYVGWIRDRANAFGTPADMTIHIDLYGMGTVEFGDDAVGLLECLMAAERAAAPYRLQIETPIDVGSTSGQCAALLKLRDELRARGSSIRLVADEWCNTLEDISQFAQAGAAHLIQIKMPDVGRIQDSIRAVLACKASGVGAYLGGSCAETELSAAVSVHIAVATRADLLLAKPAMDVDAAITIVGNEQSRLIADLSTRNTTAGMAWRASRPVQAR